jgi:hypothetical protein
MKMLQVSKDWTDQEDARVRLVAGRMVSEKLTASEAVKILKVELQAIVCPYRTDAAYEKRLLRDAAVLRATYPKLGKKKRKLA